MIHCIGIAILSGLTVAAGPVIRDLTIKNQWSLGPGAWSYNKQQFNDCHDVSADPGPAHQRSLRCHGLSPDTGGW